MRRLEVLTVPACTLPFLRAEGTDTVQVLELALVEADGVKLLRLAQLLELLLALGGFLGEEGRDVVRRVCPVHFKFNEYNASEGKDHCLKAGNFRCGLLNRLSLRSREGLRGLSDFWVSPSVLILDRRCEKEVILCMTENLSRRWTVSLYFE
jgi:hypothetical protein